MTSEILQKVGRLWGQRDNVAHPGHLHQPYDRTNANTAACGSGVRVPILPASQAGSRSKGLATVALMSAEERSGRKSGSFERSSAGWNRSVAIGGFPFWENAPQVQAGCPRRDRLIWRGTEKRPGRMRVMSAPNSELFNRQVLNALTFLYGNFPSLVTVDNRALSSGTDTEIALIEYGTIIWLYRNGIVSGSLLENKPIGGAL